MLLKALTRTVAVTSALPESSMPWFANPIPKIAGLTNMISFMGTTDIPYEMSVVHWNQWWFDNQELHWERSPLSHINNAQTPTLIIHGLRDERVHPEQGMQLWQALNIKNVDTELVLYPREPHGLIERPHQLDYMERLVNWYNKYVK